MALALCSAVIETERNGTGVTGNDRPFRSQDDRDPDLIGPGVRHGSLAHRVRKDRHPLADGQRPPGGGVEFSVLALRK